MTWLNELVKEKIPSYKLALKYADPRTKDWFLLWADPVPVLTLVCIYLSIVTLGPRFMRTREAVHIPAPILFIYNMVLVVLSIYMVEEVSSTKLIIFICHIHIHEYIYNVLDCCWYLS